MKKMNKKGFTLVELLAVIVILALIMAIAVVSMGGIMRSAREGTFKDTALSIISGVKQQLAINGQMGNTETGYYFFQERLLEKGGKTSPLGGDILYVAAPDNTGKTATNGSTTKTVTQIGYNGIYKYTDTGAPECNATSKSFVKAEYDDTNKIFKYSICLTAGAGNPYINATETELLNTENNTNVIKNNG